MNDNILKLEGITNRTFNYKNLLNSTDSLVWNNCKNITIKVKSKINKLILTNCNNFKIKIGDTISGIDIEKSNNINIKIYKNKNIQSLHCFKSNVKLKLDKIMKEKIKLFSENSKINIIYR